MRVHSEPVIYPAMATMHSYNGEFSLPQVPVQIVQDAENADYNRKTLDISDYEDECSGCVRKGLLPAATTEEVFASSRQQLRWLRNEKLQVESLKCLVLALLRVSPKYGAEPRTPNARAPREGIISALRSSLPFRATAPRGTTGESLARGTAPRGTTGESLERGTAPRGTAGESPVRGKALRGTVGEPPVRGAALRGPVGESHGENKSFSRQDNATASKLALYLKGEVTHLGGTVSSKVTWKKPPTLFCTLLSNRTIIRSLRATSISTCSSCAPPQMLLQTMASQSFSMRCARASLS